MVTRSCESNRRRAIKKTMPPIAIAYPRVTSMTPCTEMWRCRTKDYGTSAEGYVISQILIRLLSQVAHMHAFFELYNDEPCYIIKSIKLSFK